MGSKMSKVEINARCFIRNQDCGRIFSGAKLCFIACPSSEEITPELNIIKEILRKYNIEPFVAAEEKEVGKDIFCEKICGKIIESKFCVVILNDVRNKSGVIGSNANVYYEYGMMTSMNKEIIPIQKEGQRLAFNIQSIDSIIYKDITLYKEIEEAIIKKIAKVSDDVLQQVSIINPAWLAALRGFIEVDKFTYREYRELVDQFKDTSMRLFTSPTDNILGIVGPFRQLNDENLLLELRVINQRIEQIKRRFQQRIDEYKKRLEQSKIHVRYQDVLEENKKLLETIEIIKYYLIRTDDINIERVMSGLGEMVENIEIWEIE